jgi:hypothetical protein
MTNCKNSKIYEQAGKVKLEICLSKEPCMFKGDKFTSLSDSEEYDVCKFSNVLSKDKSIDNLIFYNQ